MRVVLGLLVVLLAGCGSDSKDEPGPPSGGSAGSGGNAGNGGAPGGGTGGAPGGGGSSAGSAGVSGGGTGGSGPTGSTSNLPRVYPLVRRATPTALIGNPNYVAEAFRLGFEAAGSSSRAAQQGGVNLAVAIQERFYSGGPTELLRIVKQLDERVQGLNLDGTEHACLESAPQLVHYELPGGQTFQLKLQCMQSFSGSGNGAGWIAFGRAPTEDAPGGGGPDEDAGSGDAGSATSEDAGLADAAAPQDSRRDFYLLEGQPGGNGGAYHIDRWGNVEAWIAVAERDIPSNSQVLMHLQTRSAQSTLELALAGSGVGFCAAHLKTSADYLFVSGKTNAPPPPGTEPTAGTQYCDAPRAGCFATLDLSTDLGGDSSQCASVGTASFELGAGLDADTSGDAGPGGVSPSEIYTFFGENPTGIPAL